VAPSQTVGVSASVNLPLHHKVQKFSTDTGSPGWSWKRAVKRLWCRGYLKFTAKSVGERISKIYQYLAKAKYSGTFFPDMLYIPGSQHDGL